jgi:tetratricopeptide (TPR) repeat protein
MHFSILKSILNATSLFFIAILDGVGFMVFWFAIRKTPVKTIASLVDKDEYEAAIDEGKKVLALQPNNYDVVCLMALAYRMLGNIQNAIAYYEKASEINPQEIIIDLSVDLADSYADDPATFEKAIAIYNQACKEYENDKQDWRGFRAYFIEIMGWIYLQKGDLKKAEEYYEEAYQYWFNWFKKYEHKYYPAFAKLHYHFGVYFMRKGEKEKARAELSKAIQHPLRNIFSKKADEILSKL